MKKVLIVFLASLLVKFSEESVAGVGRIITRWRLSNLKRADEFLSVKLQRQLEQTGEAGYFLSVEMSETPQITFRIFLPAYIALSARSSRASFSVASVGNVANPVVTVT